MQPVDYGTILSETSLPGAEVPKSGFPRSPTPRKDITHQTRKLQRKENRSCTKETRYQESAGHYSACSSTPPASASCTPSSPASPGSACPSFPPPVEPSSQHGCFARSLGPPGCTYHLPVGHPRATRPDRRLLVFPLVVVLEQVVSRLVSTTIVSQVAPPAVVVWFLLRTPMRVCPDLSW